MNENDNYVAVIEPDGLTGEERVEKVWVFAIDHESGAQMVPAYHHPTVGALPLFTTDPAKLPALADLAKRMAIGTGMTLRLLSFENPKELLQITPD